MKTFKVIGGILLMLLLSNLVQATLGTYVEGDVITYTVVCVTNEGNKDIGCSGADDDILDPDDTVAKAPTSALAEVSDANFPGLWRGSYTVPGSALVGTWSIFIELTNSNATTAATTLNFQVVNSDSGFNEIADKIDTVDTTADSILDDTGTTGVVIAAAQTVATCTAVTDDVGITAAAVDNIWGEDVSGYSSPKVGYYVKELYDNQTSFVTATGFSTLTAADNIGINWNDISNPTTAIDLSGTNISTVDTCSALTANNDKTGYTLSTQDWTTDSDLIPLCKQTNLTDGIIVLTSATETQVDNIETDTNELQLNQSSFITATGFQTETNANTRYDAVKANFSDVIVHGDLYWNSTSGAGLATQDNITDLETHGDANWITATGFETEVVALSRYVNITALVQGLNNLSASDVWDYATKLITGGSLTTPEDYKADVSSLATTVELAQNTTAVINHGDLHWNSSTVSDFMTQDNYTDLKTYGDSGWATATGFSTPSDLDGLATSANLSQNITAIITQGNTAWTTATGFQTESDAATRYNVLVANATDIVEHGDSTWTTATGFSTHNESDVWGVTERELTYYPPTTAIVSLDFSRSGLINSTYYDVGRGHILGTLPPCNDESFKDYYYKRYNFDIGAVPDNVTGAWLIIWLKKVGSPTGDLTIDAEGSLINTIDVSTLTTDYQKFEIPIGSGNITDGYIEIGINGSATWTQANDVVLGACIGAGIISEESSDGSTWTHPTHEYIIGLTIEYNQKSMATMVNEKSINIHKTYPTGICPGQTLLATLASKDYQGNALDILKLPKCKLMEIKDNGVIALNTTSNIDEHESTYHKIRVTINGTYTASLPYGGHYKVSCNETVVEFSDGTNVTLSSYAFPFTLGTEATCKFLNDTLQGNFSDIITRGDSAWITATSFETETDASTRYDNLKANATDIVVHGDLYWNGSNADVSGLATQTNLTDGIIVLTSATETQIDNIEADTDELQLNQTGFVTATGFETEATAASRYVNVITNQSTLATMILTVEGYVDDVSSGGIKTVYDLVVHATYGLSALKDLIDSLLSGQVVISTDLNDTAQYKADVSNLATNQNISAVIDHGDQYWNGSTVSIAGLATQINLTDGIVALTSATETQIDNIEADTNELQLNQTSFITATGFETETDANTRFDTLTANMSDIVEHGDLYWNESSMSDVWDVTLASNKTANDTLTFLYDDLVYGGGIGW